MMSSREAVVGYSALDPFEECYHYCEDACYVADSRESLRRNLARSLSGGADMRVVPVTLADLERDFGVSQGQYAMEPEALQRFRLLTEGCTLRYDVRPYEELFFEGEDVWLFLVTLRR